MKRANNLYYSICKLDNIRYIYDDIIAKNTKNKKRILNFDNYYIENIMHIQNVLSHEAYIPNHYNIFVISESKIRIIMSQNIHDKVINHLVSYFILKPAIEPCLIEQNIATRENKGTDYGIKLFKRYINEIKMKYDTFYVLKFDISKFFYNIDHEVLKNLVRKKIKDKKALKIVFDIIESTDKDYVNNNITSLVNHCKRKHNDPRIIEQLDNVPLYRKGKGLPIGNMTSQLLAIFYLNELDHYIKEKLKIKYYIRYMDDGVLIHHDKEYLKKCLNEINDIIVNKYKLQLNRKTKIYKSNEKIEFLGFNYYLKNKKLITKVKTATKKRYKKKLKYLKKNDYEKYLRVSKSYKGNFQYACSRNLVYETINRK